MTCQVELAVVVFVQCGVTVKQSSQVFGANYAQK
jgi:hypothetical protein